MFIIPTGPCSPRISSVTCVLSNPELQSGPDLLPNTGSDYKVVNFPSSQRMVQRLLKPRFVGWPRKLEVQESGGPKRLISRVPGEHSHIPVMTSDPRT